MANNSLWKHTCAVFLRNPYRQYFDAQHKHALSQAITAAERGHRGEIRLVVETRLPLSLAINKLTARQRAIQWFSELRVWDTEENSGIVLYLLLAERKIEILADRGINKLVPQSEWDNICSQLQSKLSADQIHEGLQQALSQFGEILRQHYPLQEPEENPDELSNELIFIP